MRTVVRSWTWTAAGALRREKDRLAVALTRSGLAAGDRVIVALDNGPLFLAALAAIIAQGGSPLLLHGDAPAGELERSARQYHAKFVLCDTSTDDELATIGASCRLAGGPPWSQPHWVIVEAGDAPADDPFPPLPGVPLHPTSGTTGQPKVAARPGPCAMAEAAHYVETIGIDARDLVLCVVPMSHAYGYGMCAMVPMLTGADIALVRRFHPRSVLRALREQPVTVFPAVPAMLDLLLAAGLGGTDRVPRCVLSAGAPLPKRIAVEFKQRLGVAVRPLYGTTETGGIAVAPAAAAPDLVGCVGPSMNGVDVEIRPVADAPGLKEGVGEVHVRSSSLMSGYLTSTGSAGAALAGGWFGTGDLGRLDPQGAIHLVGREKDVINVFGMKVVPSEVESVIAMMPDIEDVKVYPGRHRLGSQVVKAAVVTSATLDLAAIRGHCAKHLAPYKRPERITLVDALPRTPVGKIIQDQLP